MPYVLGIDVGTSHTAAAVCRLGASADPGPEPVRLGDRADTVSSVLFLERDGSIAVGDSADRRAVIEHRRIARGFVGRVGDDVPLVVGGEQYLPQDLTAALVTWVVDQASSQHGGPAEHVVVAHQAGWGPYRCGLLHRSLHQFGVRDVTLVPKPIAAVESHAAGSAPTDATLAVYDLAGDAFEASVVRRHRAGAFQLLGRAEAADALGGVYLDDALADHVAAELATELTGGPGGRRHGELVNLADPHARLAGWRLRRECADAARRLASDPETTIAVPAGRSGRGAELRITRAQLEQLIQPALRVTVDALLRTLRSVAVHPRQLAAVLLVGGSSRLPAVVQRVAAHLPVRIAVDSDPEFTVARGAALAARRLTTRGRGQHGRPTVLASAERVPAGAGGAGGPVGPGAAVAAGPVAGDVLADLDGLDDRDGAAGDLAGDMPPRPAVVIEPLVLPRRRALLEPITSRPAVAWALAIVLTVATVVVTMVFFGGGR